MYRPQSIYPSSPAPCEDQRCQYSFDTTNTPALTGTLAAGDRTGRIILKMDRDADFYLRAICTPAVALCLRLETPEGDPLSDSENAQVRTNYVDPLQYSCPNVAGLVTPVPLESGAGGVLVRAGGNMSLFLYNASGAGVNLARYCINLHGIKVYRPGLGSKQ